VKTSTGVEFFLDSNVLIYAASTDPREAQKTAIASELIGSLDYGVSAQVLQEFYVISTTKMKKPLTPHQALSFLEQFEKQPFAIIDADLIRAAIQLHTRFRISYWDGAILAAAHKLKARIVYTEDLSNGHFYGDVQVINPFLAATA
jgi:predicted nucleic acid-binding protein